MIHRVGCALPVVPDIEFVIEQMTTLRIFFFLELEENLALPLSCRTQLGFKVIKEQTGAHIYVSVTDDKRKLAHSRPWRSNQT